MSRAIVPVNEFKPLRISYALWSQLSQAEKYEINSKNGYVVIDDVPYTDYEDRAPRIKYTSTNCRNCGAPIERNESKCSYCNTIYTEGAESYGIS